MSFPCIANRHCKGLVCDDNADAADWTLTLTRDVDEDVEDIETDEVKSEDIKPEDVEVEDVEPDDVETDEAEPEDVKTEDVELEDVEPEDIELEDVDAEAVEPVTVEPEDVGPEDVKPEDPRVVELEDVEPGVVELEDDEAEVIEPEAVEPEALGTEDQAEDVETVNVEAGDVEAEDIEPAEFDDTETTRDSEPDAVSVEEVVKPGCELCPEEVVEALIPVPDPTLAPLEDCVETDEAASVVDDVETGVRVRSVDATVSFANEELMELEGLEVVLSDELSEVRAGVLETGGDVNGDVLLSWWVLVAWEDVSGLGGIAEALLTAGEVERGSAGIEGRKAVVWGNCVAFGMVDVVEDPWGSVDVD
ncbi:hypothetical protein M409DRAFT_20814 [Zasmidium cellare ATCC 36951]|uniref:Uncharacterized protein n=1 Tax=Zasmidium cellare ATCC 36951 TaxID=1080233 RepID=A0A6A6CRJ8_ZASCE|nr:uncharacterized protein M409DRAFT_20814 [Zasmidium cellare ATCC 36951]KAF2168798.1 hypothetical protein M409DRAFT_20814 [Zasmidium cellare ATCC 36951]